MIVAPAAVTISASTRIQVALGNSWVAIEVLARLLVNRFAIASLKIVNNFADWLLVFEI